MAAAIGWVEGVWRGQHSRLRTRRTHAALVRAGLFGCSGLVAILVLAAAMVPSATAPAPITAATDGVAVPAWITIDRPLQLFSVAGSPYGRLPLDYKARRRPDGSARQDTLTYGAFAAPTPYLRMSLERNRSASGAPPSDLVVTAARIAGSAGIAVVRAGQPEGLPSRFGLFAVAPMTLREAGDEKPCLSFRLEGRPAVAVAGVACGAQGRGPSRADLACALDRLDLAAAGEDAALRSFFATAERRRDNPCAASAR